MKQRLFAAAFGAVLLAGLTASVSGETIILHSGATLTAPILADRPAGVAVDLGFTVLMIPRDSILSLQLETAAYDPNKPEPDEGVPTAAGGKGLYHLAAPNPMPLQDCYKKVAPAVVMVSTPSGLGSGFFINSQGYLVTNYHVVERETLITVTQFEESRRGFERKAFRDVRIVALNPFTDLALLKVEDKSVDAFPFVTLANAGTAQVGQSTFAVGNPLGLERTMSNGAITTVSRAFEGLVYLQTNADINPGNSGGPLFDMSGQVIGVTNMGATHFGGLGFAIPIHYVRDFIDNYESFAYDKDNPNTGYRYLQPDARQNKEKPDLSQF